MSKEKTSEKDKTLIEYENLIEELMKENEILKNRIVDLEEQNRMYKDIADSINKVSESKEAKKPGKLLKRTSKKEEIKPSIEKTKGAKTHDEKSKAFKTHLKKGKASKAPSPKPSPDTHTIIEGPSRRQCPACGNTKRGTIKESIDKTHIILDYPRMYGKKLKCGQCGNFWRFVSPE